MRDRLKVAYIVRSWPRLSQTFILNELLEVERQGARLEVFALAHSGEHVVQPKVSSLAARVHFIAGSPRQAFRVHLQALSRSPRRYLSALRWSRRRELYGGYTSLRPASAFTAAVRVAERLRSAPEAARCTHIHAHFAHDPALVATIVHRLTGLPFSFTAHARDLYQIPHRAVRARAREARAVVTCCAVNRRYLHDVLGAQARVELVYHGVDLEAFTVPQHQRGNGIPRLLAVGRLVEKKGVDDVLRACAVLAAQGRDFRCDVVGDGPLRGRLEAQRSELGLDGSVTFHGGRSHAELLPMYQHADVFVLASRVTGDGDRDGVPNVVLEAMACGAPVVTTTAGGIGEVVEDGRNGWLVKDGDASSLADRIGALLDDRPARAAMGAESRRTAERFDSRLAATRLTAIFRDDGATAP